jgi:hypothetical protein
MVARDAAHEMTEQVKDAIRRGHHGHQSPWAYVEFHGGVYWHEGRQKFVDGTYLVPGLGGLEIEEMATLLADRVERDHPGKGREAFESGMLQLLNKDYNGEWLALAKNMKLHEMWGGPVPAALILPNYDNPEEFDLVMPDENGVPRQYGVREHVFDNMLEVRPGENAVKGEFSWEALPPKRRE